jgi:copper chaperone CopZ
MTTLRLKTNLRCGACVQTLKPLLDAEPGIARWSADVAASEKWLTVEGEGIAAERVTALLQSAGYAVLPDGPGLGRSLDMAHELPQAVAPSVTSPPKATYFPLLLILAYLLGSVALVEVALGEWVPMRAMRHFMAGFFLVFSFFKLLDVPNFARSYSGYDILARHWVGYGYLYPFIELALGAAYLANFQPVATNLLTLAVMGISTVGVVQAVRAKRTIRCACLGTVFNLPMSKITLIEDLLMVLMALAMLIGMMIA